MANILSIPERISLFKEINRVHKEMYGWKMRYWSVWYGAGRIDTESDVRLSYNDEWVPMGKSEAGKYYFFDDKGKDITLLRGRFVWEAYDFYHLNPYKFPEYKKRELVDEDFISDGLGKRIRPDISHPVHRLETITKVQQRKEDGKIWVSSNWLYHPDCYGSGAGARGLIYETLREAAQGDGKIAEELQAKYENIVDTDRYGFRKTLERYFSGGGLDIKNWDGGYLFAASKEWRIKTLEQLNEAMKEEGKHFRNNREDFIGWFRNNGLNIGEEAEEVLRERMRKFYSAYPCNIAKELCRLLTEKDKVEPSDVNLWWGGEPNSDACYALLTLYFEFDPADINTPSFDKSISRNLRTIINIAESSNTLSYYREYKPNVWRVIFS